MQYLKEKYFADDELILFIINLARERFVAN